MYIHSIVLYVTILSVFAAYIDLRKCFDFIDRDMMLYKLLLNNIDGKIYDSIKSIYRHSTSCVRINDKLTEVV